MVRAKFNYPDLDVLDSPLMSPTPLTSVGGIPGSAIAEKIFNDPDSWEENDENDADFLEDDSLAWLVDEIERFRENSADVHGAFDPTVHGKRKLGLTTPPTGGRESGTGLKGIGRTTVRPISITSFFEPANDEDIQAQLSKILDSGGIPHHIRPLSSTLSPPSTASSTASSSNIQTPLQINPASTVASSTEDGPSPVAIYSASTTMSFLEWYGIYPDSPLNSRSIMQQRRKTVKPKNPALMVPSPRHIMRSSLVNPSPSKDTFPRPPEKRVSSIAPPGLEPPTPLPRSESSAPTPNQPPKPSNPLPDVNKGIPSASPPSHTRTPSPAGSRPNSNPSSRSSSNSRSQSRAGTPVQGMPNSNPNGIAKRRRLPSIPLDPSAGPSSSLQIQIHTPAVSSHLASPPPRSSTAPPSSISTGVFVPTSQLQSSASRPLSASRPPLVGPAGPRTRASQTRMRRQDAITRGTSLTHRPPVLRL